MKNSNPSNQKYDTLKCLLGGTLILICVAMLTGNFWVSKHMPKPAAADSPPQESFHSPQITAWTKVNRDDQQDQTKLNLQEDKENIGDENIRHNILVNQEAKIDDYKIMVREIILTDEYTIVDIQCSPAMKVWLTSRECTAYADGKELDKYGAQAKDGKNYLLKLAPCEKTPSNFSLLLEPSVYLEQDTVIPLAQGSEIMAVNGVPIRVKEVNICGNTGKAILSLPFSEDYLSFSEPFWDIIDTEGKKQKNAARIISEYDLVYRDSQDKPVEICPAFQWQLPPGKTPASLISPGYWHKTLIPVLNINLKGI